MIYKAGKALSVPYKIVIAGHTSSGKSTLAKHLAKELKLYCIELDQLWHLPGWKTRTESEFEVLLTQEIETANQGILEGKYRGWVVDSTYRRSRHIIWNQTNIFLWLAYDRYVNWVRVTYRSIGRWWYHIPVCNGNYESIWTQLKIWHRDSLYYWLMKRNENREFAEIFQLNQMLSRDNHPIDISKAHVLKFDSPAVIETWIRKVSSIGELVFPSITSRYTSPHTSIK